MIINTELQERRELEKIARVYGPGEFINRLPPSLEFVELPSSDMSCEDYALKTNENLRNKIFDNYTQIEEGQEKENDIVVYADYFGDVRHVGRYMGNNQVISKWGEKGPVIKHPLHFVPSSYGEIIFFLRK